MNGLLSFMYLQLCFWISYFCPIRLFACALVIKYSFIYIALCEILESGINMSLLDFEN